MSHHASLKIAAISCALTESWYWGCHPALVFKRKPRKSFTKISKMNWHERWRSWLWNRFDLSTCLSSPILLWAAMALTHSSESSLQSVLVKTKFVLSASGPTEEYYRQLIRNQNVISISGRKPIAILLPQNMQTLSNIWIRSSLYKDSRDVVLCSSGLDSKSSPLIFDLLENISVQQSR